MKKLSKVFFVLIILLSINRTALAADEIKPSFDCSKAKTQVEKLICSDAELAKLDVEMNKQYKKMYDQMLKENPVELCKLYGYGFPNRLIEEQKYWLKRRNKLKTVSALKKSYSNHIARIESYQYLEGCYKGVCDRSASNPARATYAYSSVLDLFVCSAEQSDAPIFGDLIILQNEDDRAGRIQQKIRERKKFKKELEKMFSAEELRSLDENFKTNFVETIAKARDKIGKEVADRNRRIYSNMQDEVASYFSNACDFVAFTCSDYSDHCPGIRKVKYKESDGIYTLSTVGSSQACQYFYLYEKEGERTKSKDVKIPSKPDSCYSASRIVYYKNNSYLKLPQEAVYEDLGGAEYGLYRFDQNKRAFVYDCAVKK